MPEVETRWPCPVCLGVTMEKATVGAAGELVLDHCPRCGGVWFELGEVQELRRQRPEALLDKLGKGEGPHRAQCHSCHALVERDADRCSACGHKTRFECPSCQQTMQTVAHGELTLDVCKRCKGVWFDRHEVSAIWDRGWSQALDRRRKRSGALEAAGEGSLLLADAMLYSPGLVFYGAHAAGHAAAAAAEGLAHAPEAIGGAAEVVGEVAGNVFEAIVEIVSGIFS